MVYLLALVKQPIKNILSAKQIGMTVCWPGAKQTAALGQKGWEKLQHLSNRANKKLQHFRRGWEKPQHLSSRAKKTAALQQGGWEKPQHLSSRAKKNRSTSGRGLGKTAALGQKGWEKPQHLSSSAQKNRSTSERGLGKTAALGQKGWEKPQHLSSRAKKNCSTSERGLGKTAALQKWRLGKLQHLSSRAGNNCNTWAGGLGRLEALEQQGWERPDSNEPKKTKDIKRTLNTIMQQTHSREIYSSQQLNNILCIGNCHHAASTSIYQHVVGIGCGVGGVNSLTYCYLLSGW